MLLILIYLAFISLGLPDSLVGSAWPVMHQFLKVPVSYVGIVTMIIAGGTIVSSLLSDRLTKRLGTGLVTLISVFLTALALFGFSISSSFLILCFWAIPYGLGAGAVDAALNNYVAIHYASRHMSWLHCFWGVGASLSPYIMGFCLSSGRGWQQGYRYVGFMQIGLTVFLLAGLPLWFSKSAKKGTNRGEISSGAQGDCASTKKYEKKNVQEASGLFSVLKIPGVMLVLVTFFCYCALEQTTGLWASSFLVQSRGISAERAARFASLFYLGITGGRFFCGFVADRMGDRRMIRLGVCVTALGVALIFLPVSFDSLALLGLIVTGLGCAPIYPSVIHATPYRFGKENSQAIIGIQMASAYAGTTFMPPLFGVLAGKFGIACYPLYLMIFVVVILIFSEALNQKITTRNKANIAGHGNKEA